MSLSYESEDWLNKMSSLFFESFTPKGQDDADADAENTSTNFMNLITLFAVTPFSIPYLLVYYRFLPFVGLIKVAIYFIFYDTGLNKDGECSRKSAWRLFFYLLKPYCYDKCYFVYSLMDNDPCLWNKS